jgi:hypothetical protein
MLDMGLLLLLTATKYEIAWLLADGLVGQARTLARSVVGQASRLPVLS